MRISDWSSDVGSSDLSAPPVSAQPSPFRAEPPPIASTMAASLRGPHATTAESRDGARRPVSTGLVKRDTNNDPYTHHLPARTPPTPSNLSGDTRAVIGNRNPRFRVGCARSEEHTPDLQSLMRISYAVFCLK